MPAPPTPALDALRGADAVAYLRDGALVAHATTSLLGIGANPLSDRAMDALDTLKGRHRGEGYVHVVDCAEHARGWISAADLQRWLAIDLPGPVTWVLAAGPAVPARVRGPAGTIAIRRDTHPCVQWLCGALGHPIVSSSLNLPGAAPAEDLDAIPAALVAALAGAFVRPPAPVGAASTVVAPTSGGWRLLREGAVSKAALIAALGPST